MGQILSSGMRADEKPSAHSYPMCNFEVLIWGQAEHIMATTHSYNFLSTTSPSFGTFIISPKDKDISPNLNNDQLVKSYSETFYQERLAYDERNVRPISQGSCAHSSYQIKQRKLNHSKYPYAEYLASEDELKQWRTSPRTNDPNNTDYLIMALPPDCNSNGTSVHTYRFPQPLHYPFLSLYPPERLYLNQPKRNRASAEFLRTTGQQSNEVSSCGVERVPQQPNGQIHPSEFFPAFLPLASNFTSLHHHDSFQQRMIQITPRLMFLGSPTTRPSLQHFSPHFAIDTIEKLNDPAFSGLIDRSPFSDVDTPAIKRPLYRFESLQPLKPLSTFSPLYPSSVLSVFMVYIELGPEGPKNRSPPPPAQVRQPTGYYHPNAQPKIAKVVYALNILRKQGQHFFGPIPSLDPTSHHTLDWGQFAEDDVDQAAVDGGSGGGGGGVIRFPPNLKPLLRFLTQLTNSRDSGSTIDYDKIPIHLVLLVPEGRCGLDLDEDERIDANKQSVLIRNICLAAGVKESNLTIHLRSTDDAAYGPARNQFLDVVGSLAVSQLSIQNEHFLPPTHKWVHKFDAIRWDQMSSDLRAQCYKLNQPNSTGSTVATKVAQQYVISSFDIVDFKPLLGQEIMSDLIWESVLTQFFQLGMEMNEFSHRLLQFVQAHEPNTASQANFVNTLAQIQNNLNHHLKPITSILPKLESRKELSQATDQPTPSSLFHLNQKLSAKYTAMLPQQYRLPVPPSIRYSYNNATLLSYDYWSRLSSTKTVNRLIECLNDNTLHATLLNQILGGDINKTSCFESAKIKRSFPDIDLELDDISGENDTHILFSLYFIHFALKYGLFDQDPYDYFIKNLRPTPLWQLDKKKPMVMIVNSNAKNDGLGPPKDNNTGKSNDTEPPVRSEDEKDSGTAKASHLPETHLQVQSNPLPHYQTKPKLVDPTAMRWTHCVGPEEDPDKKKPEQFFWDAKDKIWARNPDFVSVPVPSSLPWSKTTDSGSVQSIPVCQFQSFVLLSPPQYDLVGAAHAQIQVDDRSMSIQSTGCGTSTTSTNKASVGFKMTLTDRINAFQKLYTEMYDRVRQQLLFGPQNKKEVVVDYRNDHDAPLNSSSALLTSTSSLSPVNSEITAQLVIKPDMALIDSIRSESSSISRVYEDTIEYMRFQPRGAVSVRPSGWAKQPNVEKAPDHTIRSYLECQVGLSSLIEQKPASVIESGGQGATASNQTDDSGKNGNMQKNGRTEKLLHRTDFRVAISTFFSLTSNIVTGGSLVQLSSTIAKKNRIMYREQIMERLKSLAQTQKVLNTHSHGVSKQLSPNPLTTPILSYRQILNRYLKSNRRVPNNTHQPQLPSAVPIPSYQLPFNLPTHHSAYLLSEMGWQQADKLDLVDQKCATFHPADPIDSLSYLFGCYLVPLYYGTDSLPPIERIKQYYDYFNAPKPQGGARIDDVTAAVTNDDDDEAFLDQFNSDLHSFAPKLSLDFDPTVIGARYQLPRMNEIYSVLQQNDRHVLIPQRVVFFIPDDHFCYSNTARLVKDFDSSTKPILYANDIESQGPTPTRVFTNGRDTRVYYDWFLAKIQPITELLLKDFLTNVLLRDEFVSPTQINSLWSVRLCFEDEICTQLSKLQSEAVGLYSSIAHYSSYRIGSE